MMLSASVIPQREGVGFPSDPTGQTVSFIDMLKQHVQQRLAFKWVHALDVGCETAVHK